MIMSSLLIRGEKGGSSRGKMTAISSHFEIATTALLWTRPGGNMLLAAGLSDDECGMSLQYKVISYQIFPPQPERWSHYVSWEEI